MTLLSPEFILTSLIVVASPGTGAVYTVAAGLTQGARAATFAAFACTLGILPHMAAAITGLAAIFHKSALAFDLLKYAGVAYLLWMAWVSFREDGPLRVDGAPRKPAREVLVEGVAINLLTPNSPSSSSPSCRSSWQPMTPARLPPCCFSPSRSW